MVRHDDRSADTGERSTVQQQGVNQSVTVQPGGAAHAATVHRTLGDRVRAYLFSYALIIPAVVILGMFHLYPIFYGFYISLHRWAVRPLGYIGLRNYERVLQDENFWNSLAVTLWYVVGTVPTGIILSLFLAIMLFQPIAGRSFYRIMLFLPYITPPIAIGTVWAWMYQQDRGFFNTLVGWFGIGRQRWLLDPRGVFDIVASNFGLTLPGLLHGPSLQLASVILLSLWIAVGFDTVVLLAGLSNISNDVIEAARIDGANQWQIATKVIAPLLRPTILFLSVVSTLRAFQSFNLVFSLFGDQVPRGARVITFLIYEEFFRNVGRVGYGAAMAILLFVILFFITLIQLRIGGERNDETRARGRGLRGLVRGG